MNDWQKKTRNISFILWKYILRLILLITISISTLFIWFIIVIPFIKWDFAHYVWPYDLLLLIIPISLLLSSIVLYIISVYKNNYKFLYTYIKTLVIIWLLFWINFILHFDKFYK